MRTDHYARVTIDPNVRVRNNLTLATSNEIKGPIPAIGDHVTVIEPESGLHEYAEVVDINVDADLYYLKVDWAAWFRSVAAMGGYPLDPFSRRIDRERRLGRQLMRAVEEGTREGLSLMCQGQGTRGQPGVPLHSYDVDGCKNDGTGCLCECHD